MVLLSPGNYIVEVVFARPVRRPFLLRGLEGLGFQDVRLDASVSEITIESIDIIFIAHLEEEIELSDTELVQWKNIRRLTVDPYAGLSYKLVLFPLKREREYETRFFSFVKGTPTKESVTQHLQAMGWQVKSLCQLQRNMHIPSHPQTDVTLWCAVLHWPGAYAFITDIDPFLFEDCIETASLIDDSKEDLKEENEHADSDTRGRDSGVLPSALEANPPVDGAISEA